MKIEIENLDSDLRKAIEEAGYHIGVDDNTKVVKKSDYIYDIGGTNYYIVDEDEAYVRVNEEAEEILDDLIDSEVPEGWKEYINREEWFARHETFTFEEILERTFDYVSFEGEFNGYEFYEIEGENV